MSISVRLSKLPSTRLSPFMIITVFDLVPLVFLFSMNLLKIEPFSLFARLNR